MITHIQKDIVKTKAGQWVLVSTVQLPFYDINSGQYETMVFPYDKEQEEVASWLELSCNRTNEYYYALDTHKDTVKLWEDQTQVFQYDQD